MHRIPNWFSIIKVVKRIITITKWSLSELASENDDKYHEMQTFHSLFSIVKTEHDNWQTIKCGGKIGLCWMENFVLSIADEVEWQLWEEKCHGGQFQGSLILKVNRFRARSGVWRTLTNTTLLNSRSLGFALQDWIESTLWTDVTRLSAIEVAGEFVSVYEVTEVRVIDLDRYLSMRCDTRWVT